MALGAPEDQALRYFLLGFGCGMMAALGVWMLRIVIDDMSYRPIGG